MALTSSEPDENDDGQTDNVIVYPPPVFVCCGVYNVMRQIWELGKIRPRRKVANGE